MRATWMMAAALALLPMGAAAQDGAASTVLQQSSEYRFQMDFQVDAAALARLLPPGWTSAAAAQGPAKDCNLRLIFIDRLGVTGPDGKLLGKGTDRLVYLAAPVKQGDRTGQMILAGISQNGAEDDFGVLAAASKAHVSRSSVTENGVTLVTEDWDFAAASGDHASLHVRYRREPAGQGGGAVNFYDPADPARSLIFRSEQGTDIVRNVTTTPPDRVLEFRYEAGGGKIGALFDGREKPLSWDSQLAYRRVIAQALRQEVN